MSEITRRAFGLGAVAVAVAACQNSDAPPTSTTSTSASTTTTVPAPTPVGPYPFSLGVASGDPDTESVVLWTAADRSGNLTVAVAPTEAFDTIVFEAAAELAEGLTAKLVATGLDADTEYWYRFELDGHRTPPARTRTAPRAGRPATPISVAHLSCQRYSAGYWMALSDVAAQQPDLVVHCGDYVYGAEGGDVRPVEADTPTDLAGYRALWRRYKAEPELQAAHAIAPWIHGWDDNDVAGNYQGDHPSSGSVAEFAQRRAAAYQAWWEFTPTRLDPPDGPNMRMHRIVDWGDLARFVVLDTRQYRDDQPCDDDLGPRCDASDAVSMLGPAQEAWAASAFASSTARWTVAVSGVVVHQWRFLPGNAIWNLDQWDGYPAARNRFLTSLASAENPIVLSGDVHSSWVADLQLDFDDPDAPTFGAEFVTPGVSSVAPRRFALAAGALRGQSPHIVYGEVGHRGWVRHDLDDGSWDATYRHVENAGLPRSALTDVAAFAVTPGEPGVRRR